MFGHGYFGAGWFGPGYWGPRSGAPPVVVPKDTHDGIDEDTHRRTKDDLARRDKSFKSERERLREVLTQAWDGPGVVASEVKELASPFVEILESGALRIDYEAIDRHQAELLAFHDALRAEYQRRMDIEQDDEDVMLLTSWN